MDDCQPDGIPDVCQLGGGGGVMDVVTDGGFEAGPGAGTWVEFSTNYGTPICDAASCGTGGGTAGPRTGTFWSWFGGAGTNPELGYLEQTVTIPVSANAHLQFYLWIGSASGNGQDYVAALIDGDILFTALENDAAYAGGYVLVDINVAGYADGGSHLLRLESNCTGSANSNFNVDDVALVVDAGVPANDCNGNGIPDECDIALGLETDYNHNGIPDSCETCGDFTADGLVNSDDYWAFLDAFGSCVGDIKYNAACDMDADGCVTLVDFQNWRLCYLMANGKEFRAPAQTPKPQPRPQTGAPAAGQARR